jgi:hypothetical protein
VHNGGEAQNVYTEIADKSFEGQEHIKTAPLAYCRLDTLAMVKIIERLRQI